MVVEGFHTVRKLGRQQVFPPDAGAVARDSRWTLARWRLRRRGQPFRAVHLGSESLGDGVWDVITLPDVLQHVADPVGLVGGPRKRLDPGSGQVMVRAPFDDVRPQHIPHDMRTASKFAGRDYSCIWRLMGPHGLPVVPGPFHRSNLSDRLLDLLDGRVRGLAGSMLIGARRARPKWKGLEPAQADRHG